MPKVTQMVMAELEFGLRSVCSKIRGLSLSGLDKAGKAIMKTVL